MNNTQITCQTPAQYVVHKQIGDGYTEFVGLFFGTRDDIIAYCEEKDRNEVTGKTSTFNILPATQRKITPERVKEMRAAFCAIVDLGRQRDELEEHINRARKTRDLT